MRRWARVVCAFGGALVLASCLVSIEDARPGSQTAGAAGEAGAAGGAGGSSGWSAGGTSGSSGAAGASASGGTSSGGSAGSAGSAGTAGSAGGPTAGLLGHWPFDEGTGNVAADATSFQRNGTLPTSGVTWTLNGLFGTGLQFTNPEDGVEIADLSGSAFPPVGSFSVWVKGEFSPSEPLSRGIFDNWDNSRNHVFIRRVDDEPELQLQCAFQPGDNAYVYVDVVPVKPQVWQLVSLGWDVTAQVGYCYVHGTKLSGTTDKSFSPSEQLFTIGDGFIGVLDDARLYDHLLSDAELAALLALSPS